MEIEGLGSVNTALTRNAKQFTITNTGTGTLMGTISQVGSEAWLTQIGPTSFNLGPSEAITVTVTVDPDLAPSGVSTETVRVDSNAQNMNPVDVSVTLISSGIPLDCHPLSLGHSGAGTDLVASPNSSAGCPAQTYNAGEII